MQHAISAVLAHLRYAITIFERRSERSFCFFNAVYELVLQVIARCFAVGRETPERRQSLAHAEAV